MGISPTITYMKDEPIKNRKSLKRKDSLWAIWTEYEETGDVNTALDKIIHLLQNKVSVLVKIKEMYNADISFVFAVNIVDGDSPAMSLSSETVRFIATLGARVDFCVYVY